MINPTHKQMILDKKRAVQQQEEERKRKEEQRLRNAREQCISIQRRCSDIIDTANMILDAGLELPTKDVLEKFGYKYDAFAEGFCHGVGFMGHGIVKPITFVGFYAGGACGHWDFFADGKQFFLRHDQTHQTTNPAAYDMEKFAQMFPQFESSFYKWLESGMK